MCRRAARLRTASTLRHLSKAAGLEPEEDLGQDKGLETEEGLENDNPDQVPNKAPAVKRPQNGRFKPSNKPQKTKRRT